MEGDNKHGDAGNKHFAKPKGYKQIPFNPSQTVDTEQKLATMQKTKMQHAYTFWVFIREQTYYKKKADVGHEQLLEIETVDTVSSGNWTDRHVGGGLLADSAAPEAAHGHALRNSHAFVQDRHQACVGGPSLREWVPTRNQISKAADFKILGGPDTGHDGRAVRGGELHRRDGHEVEASVRQNSDLDGGRIERESHQERQG